MNICDRAKGGKGRARSPRRLSWYVAPRAVSELKYVLTANGYVILP